MDHRSDPLKCDSGTDGYRIVAKEKGGENTVKFHNITKNYGKKTVLRSFHLELDNHEVTCLLGPSGCGKPP